MFLVGCCVFFRRLVAAGLFVVIVEDVAVLAVLVVGIFVALVVAITLPFCPCTVVRRPITFPPQSRPRVFGWLSHEKNGTARRACRRPRRTRRRHLRHPRRCHRAPQTFSHGRAAYPIPPPSRPRDFGWLLSEKILNGGHLRPLSYFILYSNFFRHSIRRPEMRKTPPPIHSTPAAHPLHHPSYQCRRLSVDCCVSDQTAAI